MMDELLTGLLVSAAAYLATLIVWFGAVFIYKMVTIPAKMHAEQEAKIAALKAENQRLGTG